MHFGISVGIPEISQREKNIYGVSLVTDCVKIQRLASENKFLFDSQALVFISRNYFNTVIKFPFSVG